MNKKETQSLKIISKMTFVATFTKPVLQCLRVKS